MQVKFIHNFSESSLSSGRNLFSASAVYDLYMSDELFEAEVIIDDALYLCSYEVKKNRLLASCDCHESTAANLCPHLWASLLAAENFSALRKALQRNISKNIVLKQDTAVAQEFDDFSYEYEKPAKVRPRKNPESAELKSLLQNSTKKLVIEADEDLPDLFYFFDLDKQKPKVDIVVIETYWRSNDSFKPFYYEPESALNSLDREIFLELLRSRIRDPQVLANAFVLQEKDLKNILEAIYNADKTKLYFYNSSAQKPQYRPLRLLSCEKIKIQFAILQQLNSQYEIQAYLQRPDKNISINELLFFNKSGLAITADEVFFLDYGEYFYDFYEIYQTQKRNLPYLLTSEEAQSLYRKFHLEDAEKYLAKTADINLKSVEILPSARLYIKTAEYKYAGKEQLQAELSFDYAGKYCSPDDSEEYFAGNKADEIIKRDKLAEKNLLQKLEELNFYRMDKGDKLWRLLPARLDNAVHSLVYDNWFISAEGKTYRKPQEKKSQIRKADSDWFEIHAEVNFAGQIASLPELLKALKRGNKSVRLDDGTYGILPLEWLEKFTVLTEIGEAVGEKLLFRKQRAAIVAALIDEVIDEFDEHYATLLEKLAEPLKISALNAPSGFNGELRAYQAEGLGWLHTMCKAGLGVCLADDMGLGKTVQVLALLLLRKQAGVQKPSLVVLPRSLVFNWSNEANKFTPMLKQAFYLGANRDEVLAELTEVDILFTTYGTLRANPLELAKQEFDYCILDESQAIKNAESATAKACRTIKADHRLTMTGTPVENSIDELFSQLEFLNPGLFGEKFVEQYRKLGYFLSNEQIKKLQNTVKPFLLRRTKEEVAKDLPEKYEDTVFCELSEEHMFQYKELLQHYREMLLGEEENKQNKEKVSNDKFQVLAALLRLRQAACHPALLNETLQDFISAKQELVVDRIQELAASGRKCLVFSQFTSFLKILEKSIAELSINYCYLDGSSRDRAALVDKFQNDKDVTVFLISLKAGGTGLNLTAAEYVFILDPWWNPAAEAQAIDRAYRIGQKKNVFAYKLIARDTVEEKVMQLQKQKRKLAEAVFSDSPGNKIELNQDDLKFLLE